MHQQACKASSHIHQGAKDVGPSLGDARGVLALHCILLCFFLHAYAMQYYLGAESAVLADCSADSALMFYDISAEMHV